MTSTRKGLRALFSRDGYQHHTMAELWASAKKGCLLCTVITSKNPLNRHSDGVSKFFAYFDDKACGKNLGESVAHGSYPQFDETRGFIRGVVREFAFISLPVFTSAGV